MSGSSDTAVLYGSGDTVTASGSSDNVFDYGPGGNSIALTGSSENVRIEGNSTADTLSITGTGDTLVDDYSSVGNSYSFTSAGDTAYLYDNGDTLAMSGAGNAAYLFGTGETVTASGSGEDVRDYSQGGNSVALTGGSESSFIFGTASDTLTVGGSSNTIDVINSLTGSSTDTISGTGALLQFGGATSDSIVFSDGAIGKLLLESASSFAGTVAGLADGDSIDLGNFLFSGAPAIGAVTGSGAAGTTTDVTITDNSQSVTLALLNQYANQLLRLHPRGGQHRRQCRNAFPAGRGALAAQGGLVAVNHEPRYA